MRLRWTEEAAGDLERIRPVREGGVPLRWRELRKSVYVRELRNVLERASILCEGGLIDADHLALQPAARSSRYDTTDLNALERTTIAKVLQECRGNKTKAARRLGLSRTQLHWRVRKYGLEQAAIA